MEYGKSCDAPSGGAGFGVGAIGFLLTPSPILGLPLGLILRHYGKSDCSWAMKSAGTGLLVGSAVQTLVIAGAVAASAVAASRVAQQGQSGGTLPPVPNSIPTGPLSPLGPR